MIPEARSQHSQRGTFEAHALRVGEVHGPGGARLLADSPVAAHQVPGTTPALPQVQA